MEKSLTSQGDVWGAQCWRAALLVVYASVLVIVCSCGRSGPVTDAEAERDADYQRARKLSEQRDFPAAAEFYRKTLSVHPDFANAHLDLGLLCDDKLGDPISAIYHYRRYLELRPDSDKRQLVEDFIERAKLSLAAKLPQSPIVEPGELTRLQNEKAALLQENAMLRTRLAELEKAAMPVAAATLPAATTIMAAAPVSASAESASVRMHMVQKGDTLYSLALRYYGTRAAWERIYQANRSGLASRDQLKVGQQLVIP